MLGRLLRAQIARFGQRYDYDVAYLDEVARADPLAAIAFTLVGAFANYRKSIPSGCYFAAKLRAVLHEDCGPCAQLMARMAQRAGVPDATIEAVVGADLAALDPETALCVRFAEAVLQRTPEADDLRREIELKWGPRAVVSLAFAITGSRVYPTLKYALGHGQSCQRVVLGARTVTPRHLTAEVA